MSKLRNQVLDVGCGVHPKGDVNVDLFLHSEHRKRGKGPRLDEIVIPNFVQADATDMFMFRDRQFDTVICRHLIEHIPYPGCWDLLREIWRVCDNHLIIECPDRRWLPIRHLKRSPVHVSNFDPTVFKKAIPLYLDTRKFKVTAIKRGMFHPRIPFPYWPYIIRVEVWR